MAKLDEISVTLREFPEVREILNEAAAFKEKTRWHKLWGRDCKPIEDKPEEGRWIVVCYQLTDNGETEYEVGKYFGEWPELDWHLAKEYDDVCLAAWKYLDLFEGWR